MATLHIKWCSLVSLFLFIACCCCLVWPAQQANRAGMPAATLTPQAVGDTSSISSETPQPLKAAAEDQSEHSRPYMPKGVRDVGRRGPQPSVGGAKMRKRKLSEGLGGVRSVHASPPIGDDFNASTAEPFIGYQEAMAYAKPFTESYPKVVNRTARLIDFRLSLRTLVKTVRGQLSGRLPVMDAARVDRYVDDRLPAAVFTIVMNEPIYLQAWLAHYNKTFLPKDMYVMDNNGGRDGTTGGLAAMGINVVMARCDHSYLDHHCILSYVSTMSRLLLSTYKVVVYTDVDELLYSSFRKK